MATDVAGHTVPSGSDYAARKSLLDLSLTIPGTGIKTCASEAAANLYITNLKAALSTAGLPAISADNPAYVGRADLGGVLYRHNGTGWTPVPGYVGPWTPVTMAAGWTVSSSLAWRINGSTIDLLGQFGYGANGNGEVGAGDRGVIATMPTVARPSQPGIYRPIGTWRQGDTPQTQPKGILSVNQSGEVRLLLTGAAQYIQACTSYPLG